MTDPMDAFVSPGSLSVVEILSAPIEVVKEQPHYCPSCEYFRNLDTEEHPPKGALTPSVLEDAEMHALYGCFNPHAWIDPMPMGVNDIQLLRAVTCGSFKIWEDYLK